MSRRKALYEGKAKTVYEGPEPGTLIQYFRDDVRGGIDKSAVTIAGKGVLNNRISANLMSKLEGVGIPTHFIRSLNMREQLVRKLEIIPLEIGVHNLAAGSICSRLGVKEGTFLSQPLIEFYYKKEDLQNPIVSEQHIFAFDWADPYELEEMMMQALRVNDFLTGLFSAIGVRLIDFKLEFGRLWGDNDELYIILADEISPDNCRLWDAETGESMDKDRLQKDMNNVIEGYQEIAKRLGLVPQSGIIKDGDFDEQVAGDLKEIENEVAKKRNLRSVKKSSKIRS